MTFKAEGKNSINLRIIKWSLKLLTGVFITLLLGLFAISYFTDITFIKPYVVLSGSMEPSIKTASVVFNIPKSSYLPGDVITFAPNGNYDNLVTHRIGFKLYPNGTNNPPQYLTTGDANDNFDRWEVSQEDIVGKVIFSLPYLGRVVDFAKQPYGFILLVIIPATIVIYEELKVITRESLLFLKKVTEEVEIRRFFPKRKKKRKAGELIKDYENVEEKNVRLSPLASMILPVFGSTIVLIAASSSFFSDVETSIGNVFQASDQFGPPIAQVLVIHEVLPLSNCSLGNDFAQWIEIYNGYDIQVNLQDFSIRDGDGNTVALVNAGNIILQPGEFALLSHDNSIWNQCYEDNDVLTANLGTGDLDLNTGVLELLDSDDLVIDHVEWNLDNPDNPDPQINESIERVSLGQDSVTGDGWGVLGPLDFNEQCPPTPGFWQETTGGCQVVINEINWAGSHLSNPDGPNDEWIELRNLSSSTVNIDDWSIEGAVQGSGSFEFGSNSYTINPNDFFLISNFDQSTSKIDVTPNIVDTDIQLDNNNPQYILRDIHDNIVDIADDGSGTPLAGSNTEPKKSMERVSSPGDGTLQADWMDADTHTGMDGSDDLEDEFGTPGASNEL